MGIIFVSLLCKKMINKTIKIMSKSRDIDREWSEIEKRVEEISNKPKFREWIKKNNEEIEEMEKEIEKNRLNSSLN